MKSVLSFKDCGRVFWEQEEQIEEVLSPVVTESLWLSDILWGLCSEIT